MTKQEKVNPLSRFILMGLYVEIHRELKKNDISPREILGERSRIAGPNSEKTIEIIKNSVSKYSFDEQVYLRALNDQQRFFLGDDLMQVAIALNEVLPRFKDMDQEERANFKEVEKFPPKTVISASELVYEHLTKEEPSYLRRLILNAVNTGDYYMQHTPLSDKETEEMELISADWLLSKEKTDKEILSILSMVDSKGRPQEMRDTDVPRFRFIHELIPSLLAISSFKRSETTNFARFVVLLPSVLTWVLGDEDFPLKTSEEDPILDILESMMTFTRAFQANADKAARLRQMVHHGFPVYKELLDLSKNQNTLLSWNFESIVYRLSNNIEAILRNRTIEEPIMRFFVQSGILSLYARHKNAYIERTN